MKNLLSIAVAAVVALSLTMPLRAHEVTHTGTAVAMKVNKYAQPSGPAREVTELEVTVVDPKTKKSENKIFTITTKTRILRDGKAVPAGKATVQAGESVAVVVDHDKPGDEAIEVRLSTKK
jgi:hypothetical protein